MRTSTVGALLLSATFWAGTVTAQDINTIVGAPSNAVLNPGTDGAGNNTWVGQTFTVPAAQTFLSSIAFQVGLLFSPTNVGANIVIRQWPLPGTPVSAIDSVIVAAPTKIWSDTTSQISISVGQYLTPNATYVAYIEATGSYSGDTWQMRLWNNNYSGGFVVNKSGSANWQALASYDAGFKADFETSPIPEPATVVLLGTGLIGMAGWGFGGAGTCDRKRLRLRRFNQK